MRGWPVLLALLLAGVAHGAPSRFVPRSLTLDGQRYRYQVFVPDGWTAKRRWPVVLFLHGIGERGNDNQTQLGQGLPPWLREHGQRFPAVVVIPQAPLDGYWDGRDERMAMQALEQSVAAFHGDRHRLYLTGLSMGGYGAWQIAIDHPGRFAAAAIIAGALRAPPNAPDLRVRGIPHDADPYAWVASHIGVLPVWLFHGGADDVVPPQDDRRLTAALQARGETVRHTEFPGVGHVAWVRAYATPGLWPWMFSHRLAHPAPPQPP